MFYDKAKKAQQGNLLNDDHQEAQQAENIQGDV